MRFATKSMCLLGAGWAVLAVLTPFYHPYARLWLPLEAFSWLFMGGLFVSIRSSVRGRGTRCQMGMESPVGSAAVVRAALRRWGRIPGDCAGLGPGRRRCPGLLDPSDSLRQACRSILSELPEDVRNLRVFARPPVTFYLALAGRVAVDRQPDLDHLLEQGDPASWAVLDMAMIRQDNVWRQGPGSIARATGSWFATSPRRSICRRSWTSIPRPRADDRSMRRPVFGCCARKRTGDVR